MGTLYWVGGAGTWDTGASTHWSDTSGGPGVMPSPTQIDNVVFDANSGSGAVTCSGLPICAYMNTTGYTGSLSGALIARSDVILGSAAGTYTGLDLEMTADAGPVGLTSAGKTIGSLTLSASTGKPAVVSCTDALSVSGAVTLQTNGTDPCTLKLKHGVSSSVGSFVTTAPSSGTNTLCSTSAGTRATLSDVSGTNTLSYVTAQDIAFTGGATWAVGTGFVDGGNNIFGVDSGTAAATQLFFGSVA